MPSEQSSPLTIAIVGGGIAGLTAAYELTRHPDRRINVTIYEAGDALGGLAAGFKGRAEWDWPLEKFYHHLFTNDEDIISLTRELGLSHLLETHNPTTAIHYQGQNYPFDSPRRALAFPLIPFIDRVRMGLVIAYLRYRPAPPWRQYDRILADPWLRRWMGEKAYRSVWEFQLQGKFGQHYDEVNLAWFWARIYKRTMKLSYYRGGFQALIDGLARSVASQGAHIQIETQVQSVRRASSGRFSVTVANQPPAEFDAVISTTSPGLMARLAPDLSADYLSQLAHLKSMGAVVLTVALDRQLTDNLYWISLPKAEGVPFLALVEHTNMISPQHYGGDHLLYLGDYLDPDHPYFDMDVEDILGEFLPALRRFNPDFQPGWVTGAWLHRAKYAQPVPGVGYADLIPDIRTTTPGLYLASMSQVYPWDRGTNYAVQLGRKVATMVMEDADRLQQN